MLFNGLHDKSFEAWVSDDEELPRRPSGPGSPLTIDNDVCQLLSPIQEDTEHCYLLVKNLPPTITEREVWSIFQDSVSLEKVFILPKISNVYLKFTSAVEIKSILASNESMPMVYQGQRLKVGSVMKLPLDLNNASRVVLMTLYDEKIEVTAQAVYQLFKEAARPLRIIVFKKKNYQVFLEFDSVEEAAAFKDNFDNINYNGFFYMKVQFTRKQSLNITKNSPMEHDFTPYHDYKARYQTVDLTFLDQDHGRAGLGGHGGLGGFGGPCLPWGGPGNMVPSLQSFDDFEGGLGGAELTKEPANDLTLDTSEDKAEYFYLLHLDNLSSEVRVKGIFNLFSLYGNIEKISAEFPRKRATVFFLTEFEQMTAHHCLDKMKLFGSDLNITTSKVPRTAPIPSLYPNLVHYKKNSECRQMTTMSKLRVINKPNHVLYVFNLSPGTTLEALRALLGKEAPVEDLYFSNDSRNSALVFFKTVDAAARVLCLFKNTSLGEKSLKINFANGNLLRAKDASQRKNKFVSLQNFNDLSTLLDFESAGEPKKTPLWEQKPGLKLLRKKVGV